MKTLSETLDARAKTHGDYSEHAFITQRLKSIINEALKTRKLRGDDGLTSAMLETLDMTCHKIGRIIAGDPTEPDHWRDIAGYNELVVRELTKVSRAF